MKCGHDSRGECWLCSDLRPWWREARVRAGLGIQPPNQWLRQAQSAADWRKRLAEVAVGSLEPPRLGRPKGRADESVVRW